MGIFDLFNAAKATMNKQFNPEYAANKDFLEAACAGAALISASDGSVDPSEAQATVQLLSTHKDLGRLYTNTDIKQCAESSFAKASTKSGQASLVRELQDIKGKTQMCEDVYFIAVDVAAQGGTDEKEEAALTRLATLLNVKPDMAW